MKKILRKILIFGSFLVVLLFAFILSQLIVRYMQEGTGVSSLPVPEPKLIPRETTINVYTGNVVDSSQQGDAPKSFEKQKGPTYPQTDGKTYQIIAGRKYVCEEKFWMDSHYVEILQVKVDEKWKEIYRTKDEGDGHCSFSLVIDDRGIVLSPLKDYVSFSIVGWEWSNPMLVNIKSKKNVFEKDTYPKEFQWSKTARNYSLISTSEQFGGSGKDGVWVSRYNNPDKPHFIFDLQQWAGKDVIAWDKFALKDLKFLDNKTIEFSIFRTEEGDSSKYLEELARYRYDLEKEKLKKVFGK